jgi:tape measure domain-containing protein
MDLATIGLRADSSSLLKADKALDDFSDSAKKAEKSADGFNKEAGTKTPSALARMRASFQGALGPINLLKTTLLGVFAGIGLQGLVSISDQYTQFTNRLTVAGLEGEKLLDVQSELFASANENGAAIGALGQLYGRANLASEQLGATQEKLLQFTDGVTASLKVAGGSAESASGALLQLSQALGAGTVRAEEFNSILEGAPTIAQAVADGLDEAGGSVAKLRSLILEGEVSSKEFFDAFLEGSEKMKETAAGLSLTVGAGFQVLTNGIIAFIGALDRTTGASAFLATSLQSIGIALTWLGENLNTVSEYLIPFAPLLVAVFGPYVLGLVLSLATAVGVTLFGAVSSLFLLLAANPLTAVAAAIVLVLGYFIDWEIAIRNVQQVWAAFLYEWHTFWENEAGANRAIEIGINAGNAVAELKQAATEIKDQTFAGLSVGGTDAGDKIKNAMKEGGDDAAKSIGGAMTNAEAERIFENLNGKVIKPLGETLVEGGKYIHNQVTGAVTLAGDKMGESVTTSGETAAQSMESAIVSGGQKAGATIYNSVESAFATLAPILEVIQAFQRKLRYEIDLLQAEAEKNLAEAAKLRAEAEQMNRRFSGGSDDYGGGGGGGGGGNGGSSTVNLWRLLSEGRRPKSPAEELRDRQGSPWEAPTSETDKTKTDYTGKQVSGLSYNPYQNNENQSRVGAGGTGAEPKVDLTIVNELDPKGYLDSINTSEGKKVMRNYIRTNREELQALLGIV